MALPESRTLGTMVIVLGKVFPTLKCQSHFLTPRCIYALSHPAN